MITARTAVAVGVTLLLMAGPSEATTLRQPTIHASCGSAVRKPGRLQVTVGGEGTEPLSGATVTLLDPQKGTPLATAKADSNGKAELMLVGEKPLYLVAAQEGYHPAGREVFLSATECEGALEVYLTVINYADVIEVGPSQK